MNRRTLNLLGSAALLCCAAPPVAAARTPQPGFHLHLSGDSVYVTRGGDRQLLTGAADRVLHLAGGVTATLPAARDLLLFSRKGAPDQTVDPNRIAHQWISDDSLWGGRPQANQLRFMAKGGGGITGSFLTPFAAGSGMFAALALRADGPSGNPIIAELLVRIQPGKEPSVTPLQLLEVPVGWEYNLSHNPVPRLIRAGSRLLLYRLPGATGYFVGPQKQPSAEIIPLDPQGKPLATLARLPPQRYPLGVVAGRWLLVGEADEKAPQPLWLYDLRRRKLKPLPGDWQGYFSPGYVSIPAEGTHVVIGRIKPDPGHQNQVETYLVDVATTRRVRIPNPSGSTVYTLWRNRLFLVDGEYRYVSLFNLGGRQLGRLTIPRQRPGAVTSSSSRRREQ